MVQKLIKNGEVAVLYSPGFGAGWSTWTHDKAEEMLFDADLAQMVIDGASPADIVAAARAKWPDAYFGGADTLAVQWVPKGSQIEIHEYDGAECVRILSPATGYIA